MDQWERTATDLVPPPQVAQAADQAGPRAQDRSTPLAAARAAKGTAGPGKETVPGPGPAADVAVQGAAEKIDYRRSPLGYFQVRLGPAALEENILEVVAP